MMPSPSTSPRNESNDDSDQGAFPSQYPSIYQSGAVSCNSSYVRPNAVDATPQRRVSVDHINSEDANDVGTTSDSETSAVSSPEHELSNHTELSDDDDTRPTPPIDMAVALGMEYTGQETTMPGLIPSDGGEEPTLSTDTAVARLAFSSFLEKVTRNVDSMNEVADAAFKDDEEMGKKTQATLSSDNAEEEVEELATYVFASQAEDLFTNSLRSRGDIDESVLDDVEESQAEDLVTNSLRPRGNIDETVLDDVEETNLPEVSIVPQTERGNSTVHIPEAWPVTNDNNESVDARGGEVFLAKPLLPWWKQGQTRFNTLALLCLFSAIALISYKTDDYHKKEKAVDIRITTCLALSLSFSALLSFAHSGNSALSSRLVGSALEGIMALILVVLWGIAVSAILYESSADDNSVDLPVPKLRVSNANFYLGSWGASLCALTVLAMFVWERFGRSGGMGMQFTSKWLLLVVTSVMTIVMRTKFWKESCEIEEGVDEITCHINTYAWFTGVVGLIVSFSMTVFSYFGRDSALVTTISGFVMIVNYTISTGLLCFDNGPVKYLGNQYFLTWSGFFLSLTVFLNALKALLSERCEATTSLADVSAGETGNRDISLENREHYL